MKKILIYVIGFYSKIVSPVFVILFGNACRFTPTCSEYTIDAVEKFGVGQGLKLGFKRFSRCHPWSDSGYDPVPSKA